MADRDQDGRDGWSANAAGTPDVAGEVVFRRAFAATTDAVRQARHAVARQLGLLDADRSTLDDVALALSEACTNAVLHAYPDGEGGSFRVVAALEDGHLNVAVSDDGVGMRPRPDSTGLGLGLPVIADTAQATKVTAGRNGGTVIAMRFAFVRNAAP